MDTAKAAFAKAIDEVILEIRFIPYDDFAYEKTYAGKARKARNYPPDPQVGQAQQCSIMY